MGHVFVIGSINDDVVVTAPRHPKVGETLAGSDLKHFPGGKGANQAVAAARSGASTTMIGLVGADAAGRELTAYLAESGIDTESINSTDAAPTGTALITVAGGDNTIVVVPGANGLLDRSHLKGFEPGVGDVALAQFETPVETTLEAFERARGAGATTILNPAPASQVAQALLDVVDVLIVNEHEYALMFGREAVEADIMAVPRAAGFSGRVILTLGSAGVLAATESGTVRVAGRSVDAVDSTGAGDCFVGYLAGGLVGGLTFEASITRANVAAAMSVTRPGAASSIPTLAELDESS